MRRQPIPVRESLKSLIGAGLVEHRPRSGYTVVQLTFGEVHEIYVPRGVLEQAVIGSAVVAADAANDVVVQEAHDDLCTRATQFRSPRLSPTAGVSAWR